MKSFKKIGAFIIMVLATIVLFSCSCSCSEKEEAVRSLQIDKATVKVEVGETFYITYTIAPTTAKVGGVFISTNNKRVEVHSAKSDLQTDVVSFTAREAGVCTITFKSQDGGRTQTCTVTVYKTTPLEIPKNLAFDGNKLTWSAVTKDIDGFNVPAIIPVKYEVEITNHTNTLVNQFVTEATSFENAGNFVFEAGKVYGAKVRSLGNDIEYSNSEQSTIEYKFKKLIQPTLAIENGVATWNTNFDATHYIFTYNTTGGYKVIKYEQNEISYDFSAELSEIDSFSVGLQAVRVEHENHITGNSGYISTRVDDIIYFSSDITAPVKVNRLKTPDNIGLLNQRTQNLSVEGVTTTVYGNSLITWSDEAGDQKDKMQFFVTIKNLQTEAEKQFITTTPSLELGPENIQELLDDQSNETTLTIYIESCAKNEFGAQVINSGISESVSVKYFATEIDEFDFKLEAGVLKFNQISYNDYLPFDKLQFVLFNKTTNQTYVAETSDNQLDLVTKLQVAGNYDIYVFVRGISGNVENMLGVINLLSLGKLDITFETINAPVMQNIFANGELDWSEVDGAENYIVNLYYGESVLKYYTSQLTCNIVDILNANGLSYNNLLHDTTYEVSVISNSADAEFINAESNKINFTKLPEIESVEVDGNALVWSPLPAAGGYKVKINNSDWVTFNKDITRIENILADERFTASLLMGDNTVSIIALGDNQMRVLHSSEKQAIITKSITPYNTSIKNGVLNWDDGATGNAYIISVYNHENQLILQKNIELSNYDLSELYNTTLMYVVIQNVNEGAFKSDYSERMYFTRLETPVLKIERSGNDYILVWNNIESAEGYWLDGIDSSTISFNEGLNRYELLIDNEYYSLLSSITIKAVDSLVYTETSDTSPAYIFSQSATIFVKQITSPVLSVREGRFLDWQFDPQFNPYTVEYKVNIYKYQEEDYVLADTRTFASSVKGMDCINFDVNDYKIVIYAVGSLLGTDALFVLDSVPFEHQLSKLSAVQIDVAEGKIVWEKTVDGKVSEIGDADTYLIYCENTLLIAEADYSINYKAENNSFYLTINSIQNDKTYFVVTTKEGFINSEKSNGIKIQIVDVTEFAKAGQNVTWRASITNSDKVDLMQSYKITIEHITKVGSSLFWEKVISANGAEYNNSARTYLVAMPAFEDGGEYKITIVATGKLNGSIAYLSPSTGYSITAIKYTNPLENSLFAETNVLKIAAYVPSSNNPLEIPKALKVEYDFWDETEKDYVYKNTFFYSIATNGYTGAQVVFDAFVETLPAGSYRFRLTYLGDGGDYFIPSDTIEYDPIAKLQGTKAYIENGQLYFEEVDGATNYYVYIDDAATPQIQSENFINSNAWTAKQFNIQIRATHPNAFWSNKSTTFSAVKLDKVANLAVSLQENTSVLQWSKVLNATQYALIKNNEEIPLQMFNNLISSWIITTNHTVGDHTFYIVSMGSDTTRAGGIYQNTGYLNSDSLGQKITFVNPYVSASQTDGMLNWNAGSGIVSSVINIYNFADGDVGEFIKSISTADNFYNIGEIISEAGLYVLRVEVNANGITHIVSTHEDIVEHKLNALKIDNGFVQDFSVQQGMVAYFITDAFLTQYINNVNTLGGSAHSLDAQIVKDVFYKINTNAELVQIVKSITTFKMNINGTIVDNVSPIGCEVISDRLVLWFDMDAYVAGTYNIKLLSKGNNNVAAQPAILQGEWTDVLTVTKQNAPDCPILSSAMVGGVLIFQSLPNYDGDYLIFFKDTASATQIIRTVELSAIDGVGYYTKDEISNIVQININAYVAAGVLQSGVKYKMHIAARGTINSVDWADTIYINGVKREVPNVFEALVSPKTFTVSNGNLYWSRIDNAKEYKLEFFRYFDGDGDFETTPFETVIIAGGASSSYNLSLRDNPIFSAGVYRVTITAVGEGNFIINSAPSSPITVVKQGSVEVELIQGVFAWDEIYNSKIVEGYPDGQEKASRYRVRVEEVKSTTESVFSTWYLDSSLESRDGKMCFELPDSFVAVNSQYRIEVYLMGDSLYLLSGDTAISESYHRSVAPTEMAIDDSGVISWKSVEDYYVVYVENTALMFGANNFTPYSSFNINDYYSNNPNIYNIYIRSLHNNLSGDQMIRSAKSMLFKIQIINAPTLVLNDGTLDFSGGVYEQYKEHLTNSMLKINGEFKINDVNVADATLYVASNINTSQFENNVYMVELLDETNRTYRLNMLTDERIGLYKLEFIAGYSYNVEIKFTGYVGAIENQTPLLASTKYSDAKIENIVVLNTPNKMTSANNDVTHDEFYNIMQWNRIPFARKYLVEFFHYEQLGDIVNPAKLVPFVSYNSGTHASYFFTLDGDEDNVYFTIDAAVDLMSKTSLIDKTLIMQVRAIGSSTGDGGGNHLTSLPSETLSMEFPLAPSQLIYNGVGQISWFNKNSGVVYLEVTYTKHSAYSESYLDGTLYKDFVNYENLTRTQISENVYKDRIKIKGNLAETIGLYNLHYLTTNISRISVQLFSDAGYYSVLNEISLSTNNAFTAFAGGDGSTGHPYLVHSTTHLTNINYYTDCHFEITSNITATQFTPLGAVVPPGMQYYESFKQFTGSIKGNNYTINLSLAIVMYEGKNYAGFIYSLAEDAYVSNLNIVFNNNNTDASRLVGGAELFVGGLVAEQNFGRLSQINLYGEIAFRNNNKSYVSAGVNENAEGARIENIVSKVNIIYVSTAEDVKETSVASLAIVNHGVIFQSGANANLIGTYVGGLVCNNFAQVDQCYFRGKITANPQGNVLITSSYIGGIIAYAGDGSILNNSYAVLTVDMIISENNSIYVGGLAATNNSANAKITSSFAQVSAENIVLFATVGMITALQNNGESENAYYLNSTGNPLYKGVSNKEDNISGCIKVEGIDTVLIDNLSPVIFGIWGDGTEFEGSIKLAWEN